jgi:putative membrane protein
VTPFALIASEDEHWWVVAPFFWLLWFALIAFFFFAVSRRWRGSWRRGRTAHDILAERFARGEISVEEFRERSDALR